MATGVSELAATGVTGLDELLGGGLIRNQLYSVQGDPGTGKTTLGLRFVVSGAQAGEPVLYITMSESEADVRRVAASHGWSMEGVTIHHHHAPEATSEHQTMLHPAEVELPETMQALIEVVERVEPRRVVIDSMSELRLLARDSRWYRREILSLKQYFARRQCTVLLLDDIRRPLAHEQHIESIASGVIQLERVNPEFGPARRRLMIVKMRGLEFDDGYHDLRMQKGGLEVYRRLRMAENRGVLATGTLSTGIEGLDKFMGGGVDRGTSLLIAGPAGSGKSSLSLQLAYAAVKRGERAAIFLFDERPQTLFARAAGMGMDLAPAVESGQLILRQVDPAEMTPGEFTHLVRRCVDDEGVRLIFVDSVSGYFHAMPEERYLLLHLHELLSYLNQHQVTTVLVEAQHGMIADSVGSRLDISYLADTVLLLRFFEFQGQVKQALSVHKRRGGPHERYIREMRLTNQGVEIGAPLSGFQGVLTGVPQYMGKGLPKTEG